MVDRIYGWSYCWPKFVLEFCINLSIAGQNWDTSRSEQKLVWRLRVLQEVVKFLWLAMRNKNFTNGERCNRRMTDDPSCGVCGNLEELNLHALRVYDLAKAVQLKLIPKEHHSSFFSNSLQDQPIDNQDNRFNLQIDEGSWPTLFGIMYWKIQQKQQNQIIFQQFNFNSDALIMRSWATGLQ